MAERIGNVAIITKFNSIEAERAASKITELLITKQIKVYSIVPSIVRNSTSVTPEELMAINLDLIFAVGGDGTTLRAFRIISHKTPIFSMNVGGNRGILSEVGVDSIDFAIRSILVGQYFHDLRLRIQASINGNIVPPALNDITFTRINLTRTPILSIKLMDDQIKQRMDGIIISTPTGSTGHSYSNGGPVFFLGLDFFVLNPLSSFNRIPEFV